MVLIISLVFFALGLIIGSFLNVVILRFNTQKSLGGRSGCMSCQATLQWYELIPVFSFFALRGRCRTCKVKISYQYPFVELVSGIIFFLLFLKFKNLFFLDTLSFAMTYAYYVAVFSILLIIAVYDNRHKIIPDVLSLVFGVLAFIGIFLFTSTGFDLHVPAFSDFLAGFVISVPFALLWFVSKGTWMGFGDAKLAVGLGFLLGMEAMLTGTVLAFWIGAVVGLFLMYLNKNKGLKSEIPFAPFLVLGTMISFFCSFTLFSFL